MSAIRALVGRLFPPTADTTVERVAEGVSTRVYRIRRGGEDFYLRVLPEAGASFAPEALAHALLRERGVRAPEVIYLAHRDEVLQRSVMVTREVAGEPVGQCADAAAVRRVLVEAGRQLAVVNSLPVAGFGWIRRDRPAVHRLEGEYPTYRAFVLATLDADLATLAGAALDVRTVAAIRGTVGAHPAWLDQDEARLAHGDFDVSHIYQRAGRYTGLIDFGEIRGGDPWYDLGHFRMHDGETLLTLTLPWLLAGYAEVAPLPADATARISFASLLIAVRALARAAGKNPARIARHQGLVAIRRDLDLLGA